MSSPEHLQMKTASEDSITQYCSITGGSRNEAMTMLTLCDGNLNAAINIHLESDGGNGNTASPVPSHSRSSPTDEVRAPIPPRQQVLVDPHEEIFGYIPRRVSGRRSVFDSFRNFQVEAKRQEEHMQGGASSKTSLRTLEDLFRPPLDLLHKGTFQSARDEGVSCKKWLLVNVQNVQEFQCQILNRDVWSNKQVKDVVKENFILWQVYMDSSEGQRYITFYGVKEYPYVAVLDPRTGELQRVWNKVDAKSFADLCNDFLADQTATDLSGVEPPRKKVKPDETVDTNKVDQTSVPKDSVDTMTEEEQVDAAIRKSMSEATPPLSPTDSTCSGFDDSNPPSNVPCSESWKDYLGSEEDPKCTINIRFPNGRKEQIKLPLSSKIKAVILFVCECGFPSDLFELVTNFPRRQLSSLDATTTIQDAGLCTQETVFVQAT